MTIVERDVAVRPFEINVAQADLDELTTPPRRLLERVFRVERYSEMPRGGHFAALEEPESLAAEIAAFFRLLR